MAEERDSERGWLLLREAMTSGCLLGRRVVGEVGGAQGAGTERVAPWMKRADCDRFSALALQ